MKSCYICKEHKPHDQFYRSGKKIMAYCKPCFNKVCTERWGQRKLDAIAYKGGHCMDCGGTFHFSVYEFHHRDPSNKDMTWTKMRLGTLNRITEELDKCDMLCANCHRVRHHEHD